MTIKAFIAPGAPSGSRENGSANTLLEAVEQALAAIRLAGVVLGCPAPDLASEPSPSDAIEALERMETRLLGGNELSRLEQVVLFDIRSARTEVTELEHRRRLNMMPTLSSVLAKLRGASTYDDLLAAVPDQLSGLGYASALFSWVQNGVWRPCTGQDTRGSRASRALLFPGPSPHHFSRLVDNEVLRTRRSRLVRDAPENPRVFPQLAHVLVGRSYVVAPVVAGQHVAALLHVAGNPDSGTTDEFDQDFVAAYAESVGLMLEHAQSAPGTQAGRDDIGDWRSALTERELGVLRLVASGLTNAQIGVRLFIAEETVKSHVRKLMRKLGTANRAQAAAVYNGATHSAASSTGGLPRPRTQRCSHRCLTSPRRWSVRGARPMNDSRCCMLSGSGAS